VKSIELEIPSDSEGLHARPASLFVQTASKFPCEIFVTKDDIEVNGKSIMGLMMLALGPGNKFTIIVDGVREDEAIAKLKALVENNFKNPND
jgi:phosphocarrier protein HPr